MFMAATWVISDNHSCDPRSNDLALTTQGSNAHEIDIFGFRFYQNYKYNNHFEWKHKINYRNFYGGEMFKRSNDDKISLCRFCFTRNLIALLLASLGYTDFYIFGAQTNTNCIDSLPIFALASSRMISTRMRLKVEWKKEMLVVAGQLPQLACEINMHEWKHPLAKAIMTKRQSFPHVQCLPAAH